MPIALDTQQPTHDWMVAFTLTFTLPQNKVMPRRRGWTADHSMLDILHSSSRRATRDKRENTNRVLQTNKASTD